MKIWIVKHQSYRPKGPFEGEINSKGRGWFKLSTGENIRTGDILKTEQEAIERCINNIDMEIRYLKVLKKRLESKRKVLRGGEKG